MKQSSTLVFFGSGPVAAATLHGLHDAGFIFEAIITKPRIPGFRGDVPVLALAEALSIPVFTPSKKAELSDIFANHNFSSPVGLVVDFGIIISQSVIDSFSKGIINSHFSLLPEWRGADPITFALLSGQQMTGVSLMLINSKMDEGELIDQASYQISTDETIKTLTQQLIDLSNKLLIKDIPRYLAGGLQPYPQPDKPPTYSRKLTKADGLIDWQKPAESLEREVRAYQGWPKSYTTLFGHQIIITKARVAANEHDGKLTAACNPGWLEILELVAPSGRTMSGEAFLRGYSHSPSK